MSSYEEALAKQRGTSSSKAVMEHREKLRRAFIGIRTYVKREIPAGFSVYLTKVKQDWIPCAHVMGQQTEGDLHQAQIALIGPSALPKMENANDDS